MQEIFQPSTNVYAVCRDRGWSIGTVANVRPEEAKVEVAFPATATEAATTMWVPMNACHNMLPNAYDSDTSDLFRVEDLHIASLLYCLKERYEGVAVMNNPSSCAAARRRDATRSGGAPVPPPPSGVASNLQKCKDPSQYSKMGGMILSVNPFMPMPFNSMDERKKYLAVTDVLNMTTAGSTVPLPPHVWSIALQAYDECAVRNAQSQSIIISGESGSGKTENTKLVIGFLGELSLRHSGNPTQKELVATINDKLKWSNPLLESFGNAKTVRNDNSSRFGKYIQLYFDPKSGIMVGGKLSTYLLEKSRVCSSVGGSTPAGGAGAPGGPIPGALAAGERNYHVFYEMLAGLSEDEKRSLGGLKTANDYSCLLAAGLAPVPGAAAPSSAQQQQGVVGVLIKRRSVDGKSDVNDGQEFRDLVAAMEAMGINSTRRWTIWCVLAAILHLSSLRFEENPADGKAKIGDGVPLQTAAMLLGLNADVLALCFLEKSKSAIMTTLSTVTEAGSLRDAFCKCLYVGVFDYLVSVVNQAIGVGLDAATAAAASGGGGRAGAAATSLKYIGILDIFGFENFKVNSFEQLCINFANEALQNQYNKFTFIHDMAECSQEGITLDGLIVPPDNSLCVKLIEDPRQGIFAFLDEQCYVRGGTAANFTETCWNVFKDTPTFMKPKSTVATSFGIHHYAADVMYHTEGWLAKNSDPVRDETKDCLKKTTNRLDAAFIGSLLDGVDTMGGGGGGGAPAGGKPDAKKRTSVSSRFRDQLQALRLELESTEPHYIRCMKPNPAAVPLQLDHAYVGAQLESAGVLQTIALKRQGFPIRRPFEAFAKYFHSLVSPKMIRPLMVAGKYKEACNVILSYYTDRGIYFKWKLVATRAATASGSSGMSAPKPWALGTTKVFCKPEVWYGLDKTLLKRNRRRVKLSVAPLKRWIRRFREKKAAELERKRAEEIEKVKREAEEQLRRQQQASASAAAAGVTRNTSHDIVPYTAEKVEWFEDLCRLFNKLDCEVVYDVVGRFRDKISAAKALGEIQDQQWDKTLPANFVRLITVEMRLSPTVAANLSKRGIDTVGALFALTESEQVTLGFSEPERTKLRSLMMQQESEHMMMERLRASGTGAISVEELHQLCEEAEELAARRFSNGPTRGGGGAPAAASPSPGAPPASRPSGVPSTRPPPPVPASRPGAPPGPAAPTPAVRDLMSAMAVTQDVAERALMAAGGNPSTAAALILDGRVPPPQTYSSPPRSAPPPTLQSSPSGGSFGQPPRSGSFQQGSFHPPLQVPPPVPGHNVPFGYPVQGVPTVGVVPVPGTGPTPQYPYGQSQYHAPPPPPPPSYPAPAGPPPIPQQQVAVTPAKVAQLRGMGFDEFNARVALERHNDNLEAALNSLLSS